MALHPQLAADLLPWIVSGAVAAVATAVAALWYARGDSALRSRHESWVDAARAPLSRDRAVLHAVLDAMDEGVIVAAPDGRFVVFNRAARRITDRGPADVAPERWPEVYRAFHSDTKTPLGTDDLILLKALRGEEPDPLDAYFRHDGGGGAHVRGVAKPLHDPAGTLLGGVLVMRDTTERRRTDAEGRSLVEELARRNQDLERFAHTVAHELRSPLVTITGFLGLLRKDVEQRETERLAGDMDRIAEAVDRMAVLLEDLLALSRSEVVVDAAGTVDLDELVGEVLHSLADRIEAAGVEVRVGEGLPTVLGDRQRLHEVFENLIDNSLKFMGDQPAPMIEVGVRDAADETVCCVSDNGIGIPVDHRDRVFRIFERLDLGTPGTGIGLALVKGIVEAHRGTVWIETGPGGVGSTFCFNLPKLDSR